MSQGNKVGQECADTLTAQINVWYFQVESRTLSLPPTVELGHLDDGLQTEIAH